MPTTVMLTSLCESNLDSDVTIYVVVDDSVSRDDKNFLITSCRNDKQKIFFTCVHDNLLGHFPNLGGQAHVSQATYYRLFLTDILPECVDKVIYLDGDMIVRHSLELIWNMDMNDKAIAAVPDADENIQLKRMNYPNKYGYFNGGLLIVNLRKWREKNLLSEFKNYIIQNASNLKFHDQDVLNNVLIRDKINLSLTYNLQSQFLYQKQYVCFDWEKYEKDLYSVIQDPVVVHFDTLKPWFTGCANPFCSEWQHYLEETPFSDYRIKDQKKSFKRMVGNVLRRLHLLAPLYTDKFKYISSDS